MKPYNRRTGQELKVRKFRNTSDNHDGRKLNRPDRSHGYRVVSAFLAELNREESDSE